jgi:hypothetical protein
MLEFEGLPKAAVIGAFLHMRSQTGEFYEEGPCRVLRDQYACGSLPEPIRFPWCCPWLKSGSREHLVKVDGNRI